MVDLWLQHASRPAIGPAEAQHAASRPHGAERVGRACIAPPAAIPIGGTRRHRAWSSGPGLHAGMRAPPSRPCSMAAAAGPAARCADRRPWCMHDAATLGAGVGHGQPPSPAAASRRRRQRPCAAGARLPAGVGASLRQEPPWLPSRPPACSRSRSPRWAQGGGGGGGRLQLGWVPRPLLGAPCRSERRCLYLGAVAAMVHCARRLLLQLAAAPMGCCTRVQDCLPAQCAVGPERICVCLETAAALKRRATTACTLGHWGRPSASELVASAAPHRRTTTSLPRRRRSSSSGRCASAWNRAAFEWYRVLHLRARVSASPLYSPTHPCRCFLPVGRRPGLPLPAPRS